MSQESEQIHEKCGVFAYSGDRSDAALVTFFGLYALKHRGQESAGIATFEDASWYIHRGMGSVTDVFTSQAISQLKGNITVGHTRYSTNGSSVIDHAQPIIYPGKGDEIIALAHNGNIHNVRGLKEALEKTSYSTDGLNDSEMIAAHISSLMHHKGAHLEDAVYETYPLLKGGAFAIAIATRNKLVAFRDGYGIRPLSIGRVDNGIVVASESAAIAAVEGIFLRDVQPREMVVIEDGEIKQFFLEMDSSRKATLCYAEYVYLMRPDSKVRGQLVSVYRQDLGRNLAVESPVDADLVVAVPNSAIPAAQGYSEELGIPNIKAILRMTSKRSFIEPDQQAREVVAQAKFRPQSEILRGRKVVVVDDTLVRGTTLIALIRMIREAGAVKVDIRISSPPIIGRDPYGINIPTKRELIACRYRLKEIAGVLGADSLKYLSRQSSMSVIGEEFVTDHIITEVYPTSYRSSEDD